MLKNKGGLMLSRDKKKLVVADPDWIRDYS